MLLDLSPDQFRALGYRGPCLISPAVEARNATEGVPYKTCGRVKGI